MEYESECLLKFLSKSRNLLTHQALHFIKPGAPTEGCHFDLEGMTSGGSRSIDYFERGGDFTDMIPKSDDRKKIIRYYFLLKSLCYLLDSARVSAYAVFR